MKAEFDKWLQTPEAKERGQKNKLDAEWYRERMRFIFDPPVDEARNTGKVGPQPAPDMGPLSDNGINGNGSSHPGSTENGTSTPPAVV